MRYFIIVIIALLGSSKLSAQTVVTDTLTTNKVYMRFGIEPSYRMTFGYQHNFDLGMKDRELTVYGEWGSPTHEFGFKNSEVKVGGIIPIYQVGSFKLVNNLGLSAGKISTKHFESGKFSISNKISLGFYKNKWFAAGTAEYEKIVLNHIEHTDFYRTAFYEDAKDGWYKGAGGAFQFGVEGGVTLRQIFDIYAEIKVPFTEKFNSYGGSPFHVNLGLAYRF